MGSAAILSAGFSDPVHDAQHVFRGVMQAMARPGMVQPLRDYAAGIGHCHGTAIALLLALCDYETPVWLDPEIAGEELTRFLQFQTGAPLTTVTKDAAFAVIASPHRIAPLDRFSAGITDYPDRAATLIVLVEDFTRSLALDGPGIRGEIRFGVTPQPDDFAGMLRSNHARFPLGADFIFCSPDGIAALPRTARVRDH